MADLPDTLLTPEESKACAALMRAAANWPPSLWLWSADGDLYVMRTNEKGERVYTRGDRGGVDPDYIVARIEIPNDGGDW